MTTGRLGSTDLAVATDTLLFTAEVNQTFNVRFANRNATQVRVRLCIGFGASPAPADWVTPDVACLGNGIVEDFGLVCSPGEKVWARSDTANVSVRAHGM